MNFLVPAIVISLAVTGCNQITSPSPAEDNTDLALLSKKYYDERMRLLPLEATYNGDNRYNDLLPVEFTDSYFDTLRLFFSGLQNDLEKFERRALNENDRITYDILKNESEKSLEGIQKKFMLTSFLHIDGHTPFNQFWGLPISMGQMGSGSGIQPFKTTQDYDNWVKRASAFNAWADSAIIYFKKSMAENYVLPEKLVVKMIPQMQDMVVDDVTKSLFYGPVNHFPETFNEEDKKKYKEIYTELIKDKIIPAYRKLGDFLKNEYLPHARTSTGISAVPGGSALYNYFVKSWTTTDKTPDEIYNTGLSEVARIKGLMDSVKNEVGFKGSLQEFFEFMKTDKQFMPFRTPDGILNAFRNIQSTIEPHLKDMFGHFPRTKFEIRQTEAFRAASASAEYIPGSPDGSRPGIFYVPILDATKYNTTSGMESLFLHEAIPGHHYQGSLQAEDTSLPEFRRFLWYGAYGEGWALYCESLGKELGLYTDPYQYMGALGDEIHRAIRLVVDVGMHAKNMTREEVVKYMTDNEPISEEHAVAEIERYMAMPAQALSYKIGAMKIRELRNKFSRELGKKFSLAAFHDVFLKPGCMPLDVAENYMNAWAESQK